MRLNVSEAELKRTISGLEICLANLEPGLVITEKLCDFAKESIINSINELKDKSYSQQ